MDDISQPMTRRVFLLALVSVLTVATFAPAHAKDGGDGGGGDDGGGDDHGNDDGGGDDGGGDDHGNDDGDDNGGRVREAVRNGDAAPLKDILVVVRRSYKGKVVRVRVSGSGARMVYRIRILDPDNRVIEVRVNAKSRRILGVSGV